MRKETLTFSLWTALSPLRGTAPAASAQRPARLYPLVFAALLLAISLLGGCSQKSRTPESSVVGEPAQSAAVYTSAAPTEDTAREAAAPKRAAKTSVAATPRETPASPAPAASGGAVAAAATSTTSTGGFAAAARSKEARQPAVQENTPVMQLLKSAGRTPGSPGNETGFLLDVPDTVYGGEPFVITLAGQGLKQVTYEWRGKSVTVRAGHMGQQPYTGSVALAVPLGEKARTLPLRLHAVWEDRKETMSADLPVGTRTYPVQRLTVARKYVTPDPSVEARIKEDRKRFRTAVSEISRHKYWELPLERPVPGTLSSTFGLRRFFNGQERSPHRGLDFRAQAGDPVAALETGTVVLAEEQYYGGNTVIVDHGLGLFSVYLHLSAFKVTQGQRIERGETVGLIGSTGRSTGPHLHLSLVVLGESVDPATVLDI